MLQVHALRAADGWEDEQSCGRVQLCHADVRDGHRLPALPGPAPVTGRESFLLAGSRDNPTWP